MQNRDLGRSHWRGCESWPVTKIWDGDSETNGTNVPEDMCRLDRMCPIGEKREKKGGWNHDGSKQPNARLPGFPEFCNFFVIRTSEGSS